MQLQCVETNFDMPRKLKNSLKGEYTVCGGSKELPAMPFETWPMTKELVRKVERTDMRMARWMCGVSLRDKISNKEVRGRLGIKSV